MILKPWLRPHTRLTPARPLPAALIALMLQFTWGHYAISFLIISMWGTLLASCRISHFQLFGCQKQARLLVYIAFISRAADWGQLFIFLHSLEPWARHIRGHDSHATLQPFDLGCIDKGQISPGHWRISEAAQIVRHYLYFSRQAVFFSQRFDSRAPRFTFATSRQQRFVFSGRLPRQSFSLAGQIFLWLPAWAAFYFQLFRPAVREAPLARSFRFVDIFCSFRYHISYFFSYWYISS